VDVPVVTEADSTLLQLLARMRAGAPDLWTRLASARRENDTDFRLSLSDLELRTRDDVTVARLADILPVEADLARRRLRAVELDLRFRDQVIARLP
jgi:cell division protein FtsQ